MSNRRFSRDTAATIASLAILLPALYVSLLGLERWAALFFARALLASMLLALLDVGVFAVALCLAPAISHVIRRLLGPRDQERTTRPGAMRFAVAGAAAAVAVFLADLVGWYATDDGASGALAGLPTGAAMSALIGLLSGAFVWLLVLAAGRPGPAAAWTVHPIARAARSLLSLSASVAAAGIAIAAAVPVRSALAARPRLCALVDLAALLAALAAFVGASRLVQRLRRGVRESWRSLGYALVAAGVLGCVAAGLWRPYLFSTGILELVHIGNGLLFGAGAWLLLSAAPSLVLRGLALLALAVGAPAVASAQRTETFRPRLAQEIRPARWLLVDLSSLVDFDGDGHSRLFGEDCDDFDRFRNPDAAEIPGNGVDDNCRGGDRLVELPWKPRPSFVQLPSSMRPPKRVLLLVVDALRADRVSGRFHRRRTTPNIDRLARKGVRFENAYSASPLTRFAFPILFTGRTTSEILWNRDIHPPGIRDENTTIAEAMRGAGYRTAAFLTYYAMGGRWGTAQGFDHVDSKLAPPPSGFYRAVTSEGIVDRALGWLEAHGQERWFVFVHFMDPHHSYIEHEGIPKFGRGATGRYDGEVYFTDRAIGRLLARMEELGIDRDTAIVVLGDHGEMLGAHGETTHGKSMWQEALRIPLIFVSPGLEPRDVPCVTSHVDVAPTILNLVGIDGKAHGMSGATLLPDLLGTCDSEREIVSELGSHRALVGPRYKMIFRTTYQTYQLYDIVADPRERRDLSEERPALAEQMKQRILAWEEYRASKQIVETLHQVVVDQLPPGAKRLNAKFPNGVELLGVDLGDRRITTDKPLRVAFYLRATERVDDSCQVRVLFHRDRKRQRVRGAGVHRPVAGALPFSYFPLNQIVEDVIHFALRGDAGRMTATLALRCEGKHVGAKRGPHVKKRGWVELGEITASKTPDGSPAE